MGKEKMTDIELQKILENHKLWLRGEGGERANLSYANLSYVDLHDTDLRRANLTGADLSGANVYGANLEGANLMNVDISHANLQGANLSSANLMYANLSYADLREADFSYADFSYANLSYAELHKVDLSGAILNGTNLSYADLRLADLSDVEYNETTAFFALQCPAEGSFIAWKKCEGGVIVKLLIPADAKRSSATSRKCRASKAIVLEVIGAEKGFSTVDMNFTYEAGDEVIPDSFDGDRWNECSHGIHFFVTRAEAERY